MTALTITRTSPQYAAPVIVDGRPQAWVQSAPPIREDWGTLRIEIGAVWAYDPDHAPGDPTMLKVTPGVDYTDYRGARTLIEALSWADPFGEEDGQINLPAVTPWDVIFPGDDWGGIIKPGVNIDIWRVLPPWLAAVHATNHPTGEVGYWHGVILDPGVTDGPTTADGATYQLAGAMVAEMSTRAHQPQVLDEARDIGSVLAAAVDTRDSYSRPSQGWRFDFETTETSIEVRMRGSSGQMVIDFVRDVLAVARDAGHTWTIRRAYDTDGFVRPRQYVLADTSTPIETSTIRGGMPGFEFSPRADVTADANAIFGEGQRSDGGRWRGMVYPLLWDTDPPTYPGPLGLTDTGDDVVALQSRLRASGWPDVSPTGTFDADTVTGLNALYKSAGHAQTGEIQSEDDWNLAWSAGTGTTDLSSAYRRPLAVDPRVERWEYAADGTILGQRTVEDGRDLSILRVEVPLSYGDRITRGRATKNAQRLINDFADGPLITATATLTTDPLELSRHDLRECGALYVDYTPSGSSAGAQALTMRIQRREVRFEDEETPVSMTLASRPYPALDVKARHERDRLAASNPGRSFYSEHNRSSQRWRDVLGWDCESGAGLLKGGSCTGGEWTVFRIVGAQRGTVAALKASTSVNTRYAMALFGREIDAAGVEALVELPLTEAPTDSGWWAEVTESALTDAAWIDAWGQYTQACGYWPYQGSDDPTPAETGETRDFGSFQFESLTPPWLWLAVWAESTTDIDVTMLVVPEEL